jgi:hypothetical protein
VYRTLRHRCLDQIRGVSGDVRLAPQRRTEIPRTTSDLGSELLRNAPTLW